MIIYTVREGDSVYSIAKKNHTTPSRIITDNNLENPEKLSVGQTLVLLYPTLTYTVRGGDTLQSIASAYGVTLNQLWLIRTIRITVKNSCVGILPAQPFLYFEFFNKDYHYRNAYRNYQSHGYNYDSGFGAVFLFRHDDSFNTVPFGIGRGFRG